MSYAINATNNGWRAVNSSDDLLPGEIFSDLQPILAPDNVALVSDKLAQVRTLREAMLNRMTGIALVAQLNGDMATVDGFKTARQGLLDITTGCPSDPTQVDAFLQAKYAAILAALPATLVKAFAGVDA